MVEADSLIEGRGGAAFTYIGSSGFTHEYLLVAGASRSTQFDDFWSVKVTFTGELNIKTKKLELLERDSFTGRNGLTAVTYPKDGTVFFFGGQDSENQVIFDEMWAYKDLKLKQVEFETDAHLPASRNSHSMVATDTAAYIFGGAN